MSSILNVTALPPAVPTAPKPQPAPEVPAQPTLTQLIEEPKFELSQQAQAGNQLAIQLLAQQQSTPTSQAAGAGPGVGPINILA
jgi:hypothetical protein